MINSLGGGQDVVFLGRRSFRMELAGRMGSNELGIPRSSSEIPTERIFDSDGERAVRAAVSSSRPAGGISNAMSIALCLTTFALGIALTLTFYRAEPRRPSAAAPIAPAQLAAPTPPVRIRLPAPTAEAIETPPARAIPPARRPFAKPPARVTRPRPVRAVQVPSADPPTAEPWVDPFAE